MAYYYPNLHLVLYCKNYLRNIFFKISILNFKKRHVNWHDNSWPQHALAHHTDPEAPCPNPPTWSTHHPAAIDVVEAPLVRVGGAPKAD
eukprot:SAG31_NODE_53_length_30139_cov_31.002197_1_plen_89_part_00